MAKVARLHDNLNRTQYFMLGREEIIGRPTDAAMPGAPRPASIFVDNKHVSRRHARVAAVPGGGSYYIEDLSGRGTYVNFRKVVGRFPLKEGDRICVLQFRNFHPIELAKMTDRDLRECVDDARNDSVKAIVDMTFEYAEMEAPKPVELPKPQGFFEKLKGVLRRS
jgi:hypothetical protein